MTTRIDPDSGLPGANAAIPAPPERGIFCNRTLNLRSIKAIGYDMDYTLIHYRDEEWERRAYEHTRERLAARGWPVEQLCPVSTIFPGHALTVATT